jgi:hypothetical protein
MVHIIRSSHSGELTERPAAPLTGIQTLLREWESGHNTELLVYFALTDRPNLGLILQIDDFAIRPLSRLLQKGGKKDRIDLLIYTRGGSMNTAHSLVKMIRQYTKEFNVIVPFRALSAGTQIALGADHIIMTTMAQLSPVDPSTINTFNPILNPAGNAADINNRKPISVEDVQSYLNLTKERIGLVSESDRLEVFKELTRTVEPLALGNVNRVYEEAQIIAKDLLSMHMDRKGDSEKIDAIVKKLTQTYTHFFLMPREEAEQIGLKVVKPSNTEEDLIMKIFESYERELLMDRPFDPDAVFGTVPMSPLSPNPQNQLLTAAGNQPQSIKLKMGAIESSLDAYRYVFDAAVYPPASQYYPNMMPTAQYPPLPVVRVKTGAWFPLNQLSGSFV